MKHRVLCSIYRAEIIEFEQVLEVASRAFIQSSGRPLTQVEIGLLLGAWDNLTYDRIAERSGYSRKDDLDIGKMRSLIYF